MYQVLKLGQICLVGLDFGITTQILTLPPRLERKQSPMGPTQDLLHKFKSELQLCTRICIGSLHTPLIPIAA